MAATSNYIWGTGRRKTAVARVRLLEGSGNITVNGKPFDVYFTEWKHQSDVTAPIEIADLVGKLDFIIKVNGGGFAGQAGAVLLGIARALKKRNPDLDHSLREAGFLTRDSRMKERKKYGLAAARKRYQFSKR